MITVKASQLSGAEIGRLVKCTDVPNWPGHKNFYYAYIVNIQHKRDKTVTIQFSIPSDMQDQPRSNYMATAYTWQHHSYLKPDDELVIERP